MAFNIALNFMDLILYFIKSAARFTFLNMEYSGDDSRERTFRASQFPEFKGIVTC